MSISLSGYDRVLWCVHLFDSLGQSSVLCTPFPSLGQSSMGRVECIPFLSLGESSVVCTRFLSLGQSSVVCTHI